MSNRGTSARTSIICLSALLTLAIGCLKWLPPPVQAQSSQSNPPTLLPAIIESHTFASQCAALNGTQCMDNFIWPVPFNTSNYEVSCTGENPHVYPVIVGVEQQTAGSFTVRMSTYRDVSMNAPSSFEKYSCVARGLSDQCTPASVQNCNTLQ